MSLGIHREKYTRLTPKLEFYQGIKGFQFNWMDPLVCIWINMFVDKS